MRIFCIVLFALSLGMPAMAQTLADLESRLDSTEIEYKINVLEGVHQALPKSEPLPDVLCRRKVDGMTKTTYFRLYGENDINFLKAEKDMDTLMFTEARIKYTALLDSFPDDTYLMTRIGFSYEKEGDLKDAKEWYQKAIDGNMLAFDSRKRMARILVKEKSKRAIALDHIILASIMNRNDEGIEEMLRIVAKANKSKYKGWEFTAGTLMSANGARDTVFIDVTDERWNGYALSFGAYLYEPGFKDEVAQRTPAMRPITPYREALMILHERIKKGKIKDPMLVALKKAIKMDLLEEFIMYEIILPLDAYTLFSLDDEQKDRIYTYVKQVKLGLKP